MGRLAVVQLCSTPDTTANLVVADEAVGRAAAADASFVCLPEATDYLGGERQHKLAKAEPLSGPRVQAFCDIARRHKVWLSFGVHESISDGDERYYNTQVVADCDGGIRGVYRKIHLFDSCGVEESSTTRAGAELVVVRSTPVGDVGLTTCYDVRFPRMYQALRRQGASVVLVPSAFLPETGRAHWEVLLRARAVECGVWVAAAAQVGQHDAKLSTYGHSMVVDPWGVVQCEMGDQVGAVGCVDIDHERTKAVRERLPLHEHWRDDVFGRPTGAGQ